MLRVVLFLEGARAAGMTFEERRHDVSSGTIKKLVTERGFGFITARDGKDYFFHRTGVEASMDFDRLVGGEKVEFEIETSPKGPRAVKVRQA
jgi:CspA family cold shock protein